MYNQTMKNKLRIATIVSENMALLPVHVWSLKEKKMGFRIDWKIEKKAHPYQIGSKDCNLCAWEKAFIAGADPKTTLNSRNEIFHKCREKTRFKLKNYLPP